MKGLVQLYRWQFELYRWQAEAHLLQEGGMLAFDEQQTEGRTRGACAPARHSSHNFSSVYGQQNYCTARTIGIRNVVHARTHVYARECHHTHAYARTSQCARVSMPIQLTSSRMLSRMHENTKYSPNAKP